MKKKLVAFAVTAAMIVTSAVPVLAWEAAGAPDVDTSANAIVVDSKTPDGIVDDSMAGALTDKKSFTTYVDFNRINGGFEYVLNLSNGSDVTSFVKLTMTGNSLINMCVKDGGWALEKNVEVKGIVALTWTVVQNGAGEYYLDVTVDELGDTARPEDLGSVKLPAGMNTIENLALNAWDNSSSVDVDKIQTGERVVIYQNEAPEYVTDVEIIKVKSYDYDPVYVHGEPVVVTQPVEGEYYAINSITLDDGTVVTRDAAGSAADILKYVTLEWTATKANGTEINTSTYYDTDTAVFYVLPDNFDDCQINAVVKAKAGTGVFGKVTWGADSEALAVQQRLAGDNRYETAMKVADQMMAKYGRFENIVVATGENYADALSATALAKKLNAPILLVNQYCEDTIIDYINETAANYGATVYVIGGTGAVSQNFADTLDKYQDVVRIEGANRYETNVNILKMFQAKGGDMSNILVASGNDYADALSASATGLPILLVADELKPVQEKYLDTFTTNNPRRDGTVVTTYEIDSITVIGGNAAVSAKVMKELSGKEYVANADDVTRLGGANRYATNRLVVEKYFKDDYANTRYVFVASGDGFADALTGGALAARADSPIVLVNQYNTRVAKKIVNDIEAAHVNKQFSGFVVIGGEGVVSNEMVQKIA